MKWVRSSAGKYYLVVVPLHGRGNTGGNGEGVKVLAYEYPKDATAQWRTHALEESMHLTHNLDIITAPIGKPEIYLAGKEGITVIKEDENSTQVKVEKLAGMTRGAGEVRVGKLEQGKNFIATIEPMHGTEVAIYNGTQRVLLDADLKEGHALAVADVLGIGTDQVIAGWRVPNKDGKVGIKLYTKNGLPIEAWSSSWLDENGMACEDLQVMDLNGDGKPDIVAAGRATHNLKIYWNK
jgi:hypothetical protein